MLKSIQQTHIQPNIATNGLVLYLPLWERDGAVIQSKDATGYMCNVTGAAWTPLGRKFDATDDIISIANNDALDAIGTSGKFSLLAWFRITESADNRLIVSNGDSGIDFNLFFYKSNVNVLQTSIVTAAPVAQVDLSSNTILAAGHWYHGALTSDDVTLTIYLNGIQDITGATGGTGLRALNEEFTIGGRYANNVVDSTYNDVIGEVRLYNRCLRPSEIQRDYMATKWRYK